MTACMLFQVLSLSCIIWEYPKPIYFNFGKHHWSKPYRNAPPIFAHTHTHPFPPYTSMCQKQYRESLALIQQDLQGCEACNAPSHWACMLYIPQWGSGITLPKGYSHIARFCTGVYLYIHILLPFMCACVERYIHTPILFFLCLNRWPGADLETHTMFTVCKSQILVNLDSRQPNTDLRQPFPYIRTTVSTTSWWGPRTVCYFQKKSHPSLHTSA